jgi:hypothetical protein
MAIISRAAGVVLLLVGLALLSGSAHAAEPSYDDYVAQVKAGKLDIDYTAFRLLMPPAQNTRLTASSRS